MKTHYDEDGEPIPTEREAIITAAALIKHYKPTPELAGSDFDKGMQIMQNLYGIRRKQRKNKLP